MMYLTVIFMSPLYFLIRGKWLSFLLNGTLYLIACLCLISIIGAVIAPIFWALAVGHAVWHLRKEMMQEQAQMIAGAMASRMQQEQSPTMAGSRVPTA